MEYVLDTSVAVAWYLPEVFAQSARTWQRGMLNESVTLFVPGLHYWEFANVLRTYVLRNEFQDTLAEDIFALHLDAPLVAMEPRRNAIPGTALEFGATVYDALYIAMCLEHDMRLLTAERTTTPWVAKLADRVEIVR